MARINAGVTFQLTIVTEGRDAVANDGLALGAALADLQREGWRLNNLEREPDQYGEPPDKVTAILSRTWDVRAPLPKSAGPPVMVTPDPLADRSSSEPEG
jgi:hypothetical protein